MNLCKRILKLVKRLEYLFEFIVRNTDSFVCNQYFQMIIFFDRDPRITSYNVCYTKLLRVALRSVEQLPRVVQLEQVG